MRNTGKYTTAAVTAALLVFGASDGRAHRADTIDMEARNPRSTGPVDLSLYYEVTADENERPLFVHYETHDELFGSLEGLEEWDGPPAELHDPAGDSLDVAEFLRQDRRLVPEGLEFDPEHADLAAIDTGSLSTDGGSVDCVEPGMTQCWHPDCGAVDPSRSAQGSPAQTSSALASSPRGVAYTMSGTFSVRWADGKKRPGWGWKVIAWTDEFAGFLRGTEKLGETTVDSNGRWTITTTNSEFTGADVFFGFYADNDYFRIVDQQSNVRRWVTRIPPAS
jgi:hypothetical protein